VAFTLATRKSTIALNMFADAFAGFGPALAENAPVLVQGNLIRGADGPRLNVRECYALDAAVTRIIRRVTWLLRPEHPEIEAFLRTLRETVVLETGDTRIGFAMLLDGGAAPVAEASQALSWRLTAPVFHALRAHPCVAGIRIETRPLELKPDGRWAKR
jgi:DNA polymerase-3 subunit alpha